MEVSETKNQYSGANQITTVNLLTLLRKMLSYKALLLVSALIGIIVSLVWGLVIYQPSYNMSASYTYKVSSDSTFTSLYGVQYITPNNLVAMMNHNDSGVEFLKGADLGDLKNTEELFLKPFNAKFDQEIVSITVKDITENEAKLYKDYVAYCIDSFNKANRDELLLQLQTVKSVISDELDSVRKNVFETDTLNASNYSYGITLNDRIKSIDTQIAEIEEGAIRIYSDYELIKVSSRAKNMIFIVIVALIFGVFADFLICFFDTHIYFSEDITDIPSLVNKLLSCIPLYKGNDISDKEFINIISKLPDGVSSVSVSEISDHSGAKLISSGLQKVATGIKTEYVGNLVIDADILSNFTKYNINLIVLRGGIDTINQVKNIVHDCSLKGVDNYYFVLYGLEPSDKMITKFEDDAHYVKYPILSYKTLGQHYRKFFFQNTPKKYNTTSVNDLNPI